MNGRENSSPSQSVQSASNGMVPPEMRRTFELISQEDWTRGCQEARSKRKWIIVNIQDPLSDSQLLGQDVWEDPDVQRLINKECILMQYSKQRADTFFHIEEHFPTYENQGHYPYITIVNPFTEEVVNSLRGPPIPKADWFCIWLMESIVYNALDSIPERTSSDPLARSQINGNLSTSAGPTQLAAFFVHREGEGDSTIQKFTDMEIHQISSLLGKANAAWSRVPRLYAILRLIDNLHLLDQFIDLGITDHWLPTDLRALPASLSPSVKEEFMRAQQAVLTKSIDLEKGDKGQHRYFENGESLPFKIMEILGKGGFGRVDRVVSTISSKEYARKRIPRGNFFDKAKIDMKSYITELETLKRLKHHHVVEFVGSYTDPHFLGLIMSPVADCDLSEFFAQFHGSPAQASSLRAFFGCLATAISYLHASCVRHMDIKPQNILVKRGKILLTDFGISRDLHDSTKKTTEATIIALSPRYCAPEVMDNEPRDYAADIWSLGCVFLEMLTVLKGKSISDMDEHFKKHHTRNRFVRTNPKSAEQWYEVLRTTGNPEDSLPIDWIIGMVNHDRHARIQAPVLAETIWSSVADPISSSAFCGTCCWYGDESTESNPDPGSTSGNQDRNAATPPPSSISFMSGEYVPDGNKAVALYKFKGQQKGDLTFKRGDVIIVTSGKEGVPGWWEGRIGRKVGTFPSNFVHVLPD